MQIAVLDVTNHFTLFTFCYEPSFPLIFLINLYLLYSTTSTLSYLSLSSFVLPFVPYLLYSTTRTLPYLSDSQTDSSMFVPVFLYILSLYKPYYICYCSLVRTLFSIATEYTILTRS